MAKSGSKGLNCRAGRVNGAPARPTGSCTLGIVIGGAGGRAALAGPKTEVKICGGPDGLISDTVPPLSVENCKDVGPWTGMDCWKLPPFPEKFMSIWPVVPGEPDTLADKALVCLRCLAPALPSTKDSSTATTKALHPISIAVAATNRFCAHCFRQDARGYSFSAGTRAAGSSGFRLVGVACRCQQ